MESAAWFDRYSSNVKYSILLLLITEKSAHYPLRGTELEKKLSVQDVFSEMKILSLVKFPGRKSAMYTEFTANQKKNMELFQINGKT